MREKQCKRMLDDIMDEIAKCIIQPANGNTNGSRQRKTQQDYPDDAYIRLMKTVLREAGKEDREIFPEEKKDLLDGIRIFRNDRNRRTTVCWGDGSVTRVTAMEGETMSDYNAFTAAFTKRLIGSNSQIRKIVETAETVPEKKNKKGIE